MKKASKILSAIGAAVVCIAGAVLAVWYSGKVQTGLARSLVSGLNEKIDGTVSFSYARFHPFNRLEVENLLLLDDHPLYDGLDTVIKADRLELRTSLSGLRHFKKEGVRADYLETHGLEICFVNEEEYPINLNRIFNIPKSGENWKEDGLDLFFISRAVLTGSRYRQINGNPDSLKSRDGVINLKDMDFRGDVCAEDFRYIGGVIGANIKKLDVVEKSGFKGVLSASDLSYGMGWFNLNGFTMDDGWSEVSAPIFRMELKSPRSMSDFENDVIIDIDLAPSTLDLVTIREFAGVPYGIAQPLNVKSGKLHGYWHEFDFSELDVSASVPRIAEGKELTFKGKGSLHSGVLSLEGKASSEIGNAGLDLKYRPGDTSEVSGIIDANGVDVGYLSGNSSLGLCDARAEGGFTFGNGNIKVRLDSLHSDRLTVLGYRYRGVSGQLGYDGSSVSGKIRCNDPNLRLSGQGSFPSRFNIKLEYADLYAINLDKKREISRIRAEARANLRNISDNDIVGDITLGNVVYTDTDGEHSLGNINISSFTGDNVIKTSLSADFADISYIGSRNITDVAGQIMAMTARRDLPSLFAEKDTTSASRFNLKAEFRDCKALTAFLAPALFIADGTQFTAGSRDGDNLAATLKSKRIQYGSFQFNGISSELKNTGGHSALGFESKSLKIGKTALNAASISLDAARDSINFRCSYTDASDSTTYADIGLGALVMRDEQDSIVINATPHVEGIWFNGEKWGVSERPCRISKGSARISGFKASSGSKYISLDGTVSTRHGGTLLVRTSGIDISAANRVLPSGMELSGVLEGKAKVISPLKPNPGIEGNLVCKSAKLCGEVIGDIFARTVLDETGDAVRVELTCSDGDFDTIHANGSYFGRKKSLSAGILFDGFNPACLAGISGGIFSEIEGKINGLVSVEGEGDRIVINGSGLSISDAGFRLEPTGVRYSANGSIDVTDNVISISRMDISDGGEGSMTVSGTLPGASAVLSDLLVLDKDDDGSGFYGNLRANGGITIGGASLSSLMIDADVSTSGAGKLHIPLSGGGKNVTSPTLSFVEPRGDDDENEPLPVIRKKPAARPSKLEARCRMNVSDQIETLLEIDKTSGNVLSGRGVGDLTIDYKQGDLNLGGDYTLSSGKYHFSTLGAIATKDFSITDGSSIKFGGNISESNLDITAVHSLKASLSTLISDTTSVSSRRNVECNIRITEKLKSPKLDFSVNVPDLDPTTRSLVDSELNTEDKMQKQFVSLLVTGTFLPGEQGGIVNNTNSLLYKNISDLMSGQVNNILQKLEIPVDVGLNYDQNEVGTDIFDVAVSTKLFNDKVVVNGSVGNRQYSTASDDGMVGDIDMEIKLGKAGKTRLKLFSHSADAYTSYLDNTQRNGVGLTYQQEFNSFRRFLQRIFCRKKETPEPVSGMKTIFMER